MKKKLISMIIGTVSAITLFGAGAASAAPSKPLSDPGVQNTWIWWNYPPDPGTDPYDRCAVGTFCAFQHYGGHGWWIEGTPGAGFINLGPFGYGDQISSITNRSSSIARLYDWYDKDQCWIFLWESKPGNWGNIAHLDNRTDAMGLDGALQGRVC